MWFVTFADGVVNQIGIISGESVVALAAIAPELPRSLKDLIAKGLPADLSARVNAAPAKARWPLAATKLRIPIPDPGKIMCVRLNYHDHALETGQTNPPLFMRCTTSLVEPNEPMVVPHCSEQLDYEPELTIVIGKRCRNVSCERALDYVFGYTCMNEGSIRDYQKKSTQWTGAKNFDLRAPLGLWVTTADELPPGATGLRVRTILNGKVMQDASTSNMIFDVASIVSVISEVMTLEPGDLIPTGTPAGVAMGRNPPVWLKPGDRVTVDIERVGALTNTVAAER